MYTWVECIWGAVTAAASRNAMSDASLPRPWRRIVLTAARCFLFVVSRSPAAAAGQQRSPAPTTVPSEVAAVCNTVYAIAARVAGVSIARRTGTFSDETLQASIFGCALAIAGFIKGARRIVDFAFAHMQIRRLAARSVLQNGRGNGALRKGGAVRVAVLSQVFEKNGQHLDQALWMIHRDIWWAALADWGGPIH